eukprot:10120644-Heterocapsa_arctica.AAC.1
MARQTPHNVCPPGTKGRKEFISSSEHTVGQAPHNVVQMWRHGTKAEEGTLEARGEQDET